MPVLDRSLGCRIRHPVDNEGYSSRKIDFSGKNEKKYDHGDCGEVRPLKKELIFRILDVINKLLIMKITAR